MAGKLKIAVVCSSNQNRSMEAHAVLSKKGYNVRSFGTGANCKLPGSAPDKPNIYDFKTTYDEMYRDLESKDRQLSTASTVNDPIVDAIALLEVLMNVLEQTENLVQVYGLGYTRNGILSMLDRNRRIKQRPERFQNCKDKFDIVVTAEERVYDQVIEDFSTKEQESMDPVHVINIEIMDNHEEATLGAFVIYQLCHLLESCTDLDGDIDEKVLQYERKCNRDILHTVCFY